MKEKKLTKKQLAEQERQESITWLRQNVPLGSEVSCILRHVSRSGMLRHISFVITGKDGEILNLTWHMARALQYSLVSGSYHHALKVGGCGMDMGFAVVYSLGRCLFPKGFKPVEAGKTYGRNGSPIDQVDIDGGYALTHRWL